MTHLIHAPILGSAEGIHHGFFTKEGGVSEGFYASLQCGRGAKDDPRENVAENRHRASRAMKVKRENLVSCHQYHSTDVVTVDVPWRPGCLLYTSPSPRDLSTSRMPSSA